MIVLFMLFGFTTVCSVMRMVQIITIAKNGNSTMLVLWGTIEMNVGITTTCIPALSPLFKCFSDRHATPKSPLAGYTISGGNRMNAVELAFRKKPNQAFDTSADRTYDSEERMVFPEGDKVGSAVSMPEGFNETPGDHLRHDANA